MPGLSRYDLDRLRRSLAMLAPGHPAPTSRERALEVVEQLERLQRQVEDLRTRLVAIVEDLEG